MGENELGNQQYEAIVNHIKQLLGVTDEMMTPELMAKIHESAQALAAASNHVYGQTSGDAHDMHMQEYLLRSEEAVSILEKAEKPFNGYNPKKNKQISKSDSKFTLRSEHKSKKGGLTEAGRKAYNRATGSNLKRPQPEGGSRKKSFCARNAGQIKMHNIDCRSTPDKRACLARKRWKCGSVNKSEPLMKPFVSEAQRRFAYANPEKFGGKKGLKEWESKTPTNLPEKVSKAELEKRCWEGYEPTPNKKPYSKGSCRKITKARIDEELPWGEKRKLRNERKLGSIKGVHADFDRGGISRAGAAIRSVPKYPDSLPYGIEKPSLKQGSVRNTIENEHSRVSQEMKQMPKPNFGKAELEHYSPETNLKEIDPKHAGKGVDRTRSTPEHKVAYFYFKGTKPESVVVNAAKKKYEVKIPDEHIYDIDTDPMGHISQLHKESLNRQVNAGILTPDEIHQRLKDKGYKGFYRSKHEVLPNVVGLYVPAKVEE